jgi:hypothetical protein
MNDRRPLTERNSSLKVAEALTPCVRNLFERFHYVVVIVVRIAFAHGLPARMSPRDKEWQTMVADVFPLNGFASEANAFVAEADWSPSYPRHAS